MNLQLDYEDVVARGKNIVAKAEDVEELRTWLNNVVESELPALWKGRGYEGYAERVQGLKPSFDTMKELIEEIGQGVIQNAEDYKSFDESRGSSNRA